MVCQSVIMLIASLLIQQQFIIDYEHSWKDYVFSFPKTEYDRPHPTESTLTLQISDYFHI